VPTGNFGDIMAGYFAREMGLPVGRLICASNKNDVLTEFLNTGHYNRVREFHKTTSPSMDILISSNLERLLYFVCGPEQTAAYMKALAETGEYTINAEELAKIQSLFTGICATEDEGASAIGDVFREHGYLLDTHTSIAWASASKYMTEDGSTPNVILSTASPYKFSRAVMTAIGMEPAEADRENMLALEEHTGIAAPAPLKAIFTLDVRHKDVIDKDEMMDYVKERAAR
jgi:threonine synthase